MKKRILATCALIAMSAVALADHPHGPPPGRFDIDQLEVLLDLDAYQKTEVQKVLDAQRESLRARRQQLHDAQTRPSRETMHKEREAARVDTRAKLAKFLSDPQMKKFDALTQPPRHGARHGGEEAR
jgi:hypothetical protein